jgi:hypothetical protein
MGRMIQRPGCNIGTAREKPSCRQPNANIACGMCKKAILMLVLAVLNAEVLTAATTYYVSTTGNDSNTGLSGAPWATLAKGVSAANAGDTVIISGTFGTPLIANKSGTAGSPITFRGNGAIISGVSYSWGGDNAAIGVSGNYVVIDGLKVTFPSQGCAVAVGIEMNGSYSVAKNCEIYNLVGSAGGACTADTTIAIMGWGAYNMVSNNIIRDCTDIDVFRPFSHDCVYAGNLVTNITNPNYVGVNGSGPHSDFVQVFGNSGAEVAYNQIIENNLIIDCNIQQCLLQTTPSDLQIRDFTFRNNVWVNCGVNGFVSIPNVKIYNNLYWRCAFGSSAVYFFNCFRAAGGIYGCPDNLQFVNNVMVMTPGVWTYTSSSGDSTATGQMVDYNFVCEVPPGWATHGSTYPEAHGYNGGNPGFVNYAANNYRLAAGSPLIGKGLNLSSTVGSSLDRDGVARPASGAWDIGPYQYGQGLPNTNPVILISPSSLNFGMVTGTVTNKFTIQNVGGGILAGTATVPAPFSIVAGGTYSLGSNQTQTVSVSYSPSGSNDTRVVTFTGGGGATATVSGSRLTVQPGLAFPSYAGTITTPFVTNSGGYISQGALTGVSDGGHAVYGFQIASAGNYTVSANVNTADTTANSFYVNIDAEPTDPAMIWDVPVTTGFTNQAVSWRGNGTADANQFVPQVFNLSAGTHELIIVGREAGAQLGGITIAQYGARPVPPQPPPNPRVTNTIPTNP